MKFLMLTYVFVVIFDFCQDAMAERPTMVPAGGEMTIRNGDELRIECHSQNAKLWFSYPENTLMIPRSQHEILGPEDGKYTFLRRKTVVDDAGWYACAREDIKIDNDLKNLNHTHKDISWIYVIVNYPFSKLVDSYSELPKTIIAVPGSNIVVPCRPTEWSHHVELWLNDKIVGTDEIVSFDRRIGFVIKPVASWWGESILQCEFSDSYRDIFILRHSAATGPKPIMLTAGDELTLQEGDELRIECLGETQLTFFFPDITPPFHGSEYEIFTNKNKSTFLRRRVIPEDTGWYGCTAEHIDDDIPYYSINYTRAEINWVYVYVNSSVPIVSGLLVYGTSGVGFVIIPCRPTLPGLRIDLRRSDGTIIKLDDDVRFDSKLGFFVPGGFIIEEVFYCTTEEPVHYVSENYTILFKDIGSPVPSIVDVDDSLALKEGSIIRMTGEDLRMQCEALVAEEIFFQLEWIIPGSVSVDRVQYNSTQTHDCAGSTEPSWKGKKMMITVKNVREIDSGVYSCSTRTSVGPIKASRPVDVFDRNGGRYVKLGEEEANIRVVEQAGRTVKWLVDLEDFPFATIDWYDPEGGVVIASSSTVQFDPSKYVRRKIARGRTWQELFIIKYLALADSGVYQLNANIEEAVVLINVTLDVQAPPTAWIQTWDHEFYLKGRNNFVVCNFTGTPFPTVTWSYWNCPKFPSHEDCTLAFHEIVVMDADKIKRKTAHRYFDDFEMSGILTCEACNILNCSKDTKEIRFLNSLEPYFTSTNMNHSKIILGLEKDTNKTFVLECYVAGWPVPKVTWFKNNVSLKEDDQYKFAYDNRKLSIQFFLGEKGGRYMCRAENVYRKIETYTDITIEAIENNAEDPLRSTLLPVAITLLVVIFVSWLIIYKLHKKALGKKLINAEFKKGALDRMNPEVSVGDQAELLPYDEKWEFPRELLKLDKILGSGAFGIVRKAEARGICRGEAVSTVAVKLVRSTSRLNYMTALSRELKILVHLGKHLNVVNLLGACTKNISYGELFVIVEYCRFGNTRDYLLARRGDFVNEIRFVHEERGCSNQDAGSIGLNDTGFSSNAFDCDADFAIGDCHQLTNSTNLTDTSEVNDDGVCGKDSGNLPNWRSKYEGDFTDLNLEPICTRDLVYWAWQVSRGMKYLGERKVLHGDLAARNILLADNSIVKICDFGLSKALHEEAQYRNKGVDPLPVKWMSIEAIKDRIFSVQSDVWSFGIVMWEFFSLAKTPYPGIRPEELYQKLADGHRMERPEYATSTIYDIMLHCWETEPSKRPSFEILGHNIGDLLDEGFKLPYLELTSSYVEMNVDISENGKPDYLTMSPSELDAIASSTVHEEIELVNVPS